MNAMPVSNVTCAYLKKSHETKSIEASLKNDAATDKQISFGGSLTGFFGKIFAGIFRFFGKLFGKLFKAPAAVKEEGSNVANVVKKEFSESIAPTENSIEIGSTSTNPDLIDAAHDFATSIDSPPPITSSTGEKMPLTSILKRNDLPPSELSASTDNLSKDMIIQTLKESQGGMTFVKIGDGNFKLMDENTVKTDKKNFSEIIIKQLGVSTEGKFLLGFDPTTVRDFLNLYPNLKKATMVLEDSRQELSLPAAGLKETAVNFIEGNKAKLNDVFGNQSYNEDAFIMEADGAHPYYANMDDTITTDFERAKYLVDMANIPDFKLEKVTG